MKLSNENIDKTLEIIQKFFEEAQVSSKDRLKINLVLEESLLRYQDYLGSDHEFKIATDTRFGSPKVKISIKGKPFNPLEEKENDESSIFSPEIMKNLMHYENVDTIYSYENGYNELCTVTPKERKKVKIPGGSITIAILVAIAFSFLVNFLPQNIKTFLVESVADPLFSAIMSLIVAVNIPLVFISIISSVCTIGDISTFNTIGSKVIVRFFVVMFAIAGVSIGICEMFFPVISLESNTSFALEAIIDLFLSVIPKNLIKPFVEENIMQVVIIALLVSSCVVFLGDRVKNLKSIIIESNGVIFRIMALVLKLLPFTIFLIVFKTLLITTTSDILSIWKIVAAAYTIYLVISLIMLIRLAIKYKISIKDFIQKNSPTLIISFVTGSGTAAMASNFDVCKKNLNIDEKFCDFWIPLSHSLFSPGTVISMVVYAFFSAVFYNVDLPIAELIIVAFLAVQLSICSPKVNGGNIAILTILLTQLGFPLEVIGTLVIADGFVNNLSGVFGMLVRNCEIFDVSHEIKF